MTYYFIIQSPQGHSFPMSHDFYLRHQTFALELNIIPGKTITGNELKNYARPTRPQVKRKIGHDLFQRGELLSKRVNEGWYWVKTPHGIEIWHEGTIIHV